MGSPEKGLLTEFCFLNHHQMRGHLPVARTSGRDLSLLSFGQYLEFPPIAPLGLIPWGIWRFYTPVAPLGLCHAKVDSIKIASMGKLRKHPIKNPKQKHSLLQKERRQESYDLNLYTHHLELDKALQRL